jgi:DNA-binding transcriptional regulator YdaS (Cro superfamily)
LQNFIALYIFLSDNVLMKKATNKSDIARRLGWSRQRLDYWINQRDSAKPIPAEIAIAIVDHSDGMFTLEQLRPDIKAIAKRAVAEL